MTPHSVRRAAERKEKQVLIAGESPEEFVEFGERLFNHYMPYDDEERVLVRKLVEGRWFLKRRRGVFDNVEAALYANQPDPAKWSEEDFNRLALADSYCVQAEQVVNRAQWKVDAFIRRRIDENRFQAKMDIAYNNFLLGRKKYEFSLWKAGLRPKTPAEAEEEIAPKPAAKKAFVS
jgi:hypothetical protein